jgi:hypothetical protein
MRRRFSAGKCKRFVNLFPAFFAIKNACPSAQPGCWYLSHFIFGDTHYNSAGDAIFADVLTQSLRQTPPAKRQPAIPDSDSKAPATSTAH